MYQSGRVGERETRQKSVSLPSKAGELASLILGVLYRWTVDALLIFVFIIEVREQAHPAPPLLER